MDKRFWTLYITCIIISIIGGLLIFNEEWIADEYHHQMQINYFQQSNWTVAPNLTVIPGYHIIIFLLSLPFGVVVGEIGKLRLIGAIFLTLTMIPILYQLSEKNIRRTLSIYFFPTFFSLYFLLYTDIMSCMFVLLALFFLIKGKPTMSGIAILIAMIIRQNNFIWLGMLMWIAILEQWKTIEKKEGIYNIHFPYELITYIKQQWMYITNCAIFALFWWLNDGLVIYDRSHHPLTIQFNNVYFALFVICFLLWPLIAYKAKEIWQAIKTWQGLSVFLGTLLIITFTYTNTHWYNLLLGVGFIKNDILTWASRNYFNTFLFAIPASITAIWLYVTEIKWKKTIMFFSIFVLLDWLVDTRYFIIPLTLILLFRTEQSEKEEWVWFVYIMMLSVLMFYGILHQTAFW